MKLTTLLLTAATVATSAFAELKPMDWVGPTLCGNPNRAEQVCLNKSSSTGRYYLSTSIQGRASVYTAIALEPTGLERPVVGASNQKFRGVAVINVNNYPVEATVELTISTPVVPNPITTATLLTNGKPLQAGHDRFRMEPVMVTQ